jgi:DNA polymerase I-like protein with 3'-5' exonuclease and polymerase domains
MGLVDREPVFTLTGRLRAKASYCARHNTVFQGLAADGAKLALWLLWRSGYRIVNFIHDEVLIEIPVDSDWTEHASRIEALMIQGMREVVPDISIDVEFAATDRWLKGAKPVFDENNQLRLWNPATVTKPS